MDIMDQLQKLFDTALIPAIIGAIMYILSLINHLFDWEAAEWLLVEPPMRGIRINRFISNDDMGIFNDVIISNSYEIDGLNQYMSILCIHKTLTLWMYLN